VGCPPNLDTTYGWVMNDQVHPGADHVHPGADEDGYCHTCDYIAGLERDALEQRALVHVGNGLWVDAVALIDAADKERPGPPTRSSYSAR
jgi:hypothetical protein